jgi:DeoR/GlpR family transcriptional regulator of sugar metabolism
MTLEADKRREVILEELARNRLIKVADLSARFDISEVSIRRDLEHLEKLGLLKRVHGGAMAAPEGAGRSAFSARAQRRAEAKERIGCVAAEMIRPGERIIFDSGSTVLQVAKHIRGDLLTSGGLTAITGSLPIVRELGPWKMLHLILLGGIYLPEYETVVGPQTIENLRGLNADKLFLGADGLTLARGLTTANQLEAEVDQAMARSAREIIAVADSDKIGVIGLTTIIPVSKLTRLITDRDAPADFVAALR